jgi:hypothetical protein
LRKKKLQIRFSWGGICYQPVDDFLHTFLPQEELMLMIPRDLSNPPTPTFHVL